MRCTGLEKPLRPGGQVARAEAPSRPPSDETTLVEKAVRGHPEGTELVRRMGPIMAGAAAAVLLRRGEPSGSAQDLIAEAVQDAWTTLFRDEAAPLRSWRPELGPLAPFLRQFARNAALNVLARHRRHARWASDEVNEDETACPQDGAERRLEQQRMAARVLRALPEREASMVVAYFVEGATSGEVAERFGFPSGHAVHQWAFRTKKKLRDRIRDAA